MKNIFFKKVISWIKIFQTSFEILSFYFWYFLFIFIKNIFVLLYTYFKLFKRKFFSFYVKVIKMYFAFSSYFNKSSKRNPIEWKKSSRFIRPEFFCSWRDSKSKFFDMNFKKSSCFIMPIFMDKNNDRKDDKTYEYSKKNHIHNHNKILKISYRIKLFLQVIFA